MRHAGFTWKRCVFTVLTLALLPSLLHAAWLRNVPVTLEQPDGKVVHCFASGDEHLNWLHDARGHIIVQHPENGYYLFAALVDGALQPTDAVVGDSRLKDRDLEAAGVRPFAISEVTARPAMGAKFASGSPWQPAQIMAAPKTGTLNNLVVYIRFSGEAEFTDTRAFYADLFNKSTAGSNSMINYFKEVSYNTLTVSTTFYPTTAGATVVSYQDAYARSYYQPYNATTNPGGYKTDAESTAREHALLKRAVDAVASQVPSGLVIDGNNDGQVDNVCFIIKGDPGGWSDLLWPHMWSLYSVNATINNKRVYTYNFQLQNALKSSGVGVLCHEMFHSIGAPDLYHYSYDGLVPVGPWDLMEQDANPPQHMGAYMKFRYGNWIASIPEITTSGTYVLNPQTSSTGNCYKIKSPNTTSQYFVLEYRKRSGTFEAGLPGDGLLIYRVNTAADGDGNADGPPDELYLYRPGGTTSANGTVTSAHFSEGTGRTAFNDNSSPACFLADGSKGGLDISAVSTAGTTISFYVNVGGAKGITVTAPNGGESWAAGSQQQIRWTATGLTGNVTIDLYKGGVFKQNIGSATATAGSFTWSLPATLAAGTDYKVRIYQGSVTDDSNGAFTVTTQPVTTLAAALDNAALAWTTGGNSNWAGQTAVSYYGGSSARSGLVSHSQSTYLQTTVTGPGTLSFYWKVSSESGYDYLSFYVDGVQKDRVSGEVNWALKSYALASGTHTLKWTYGKDGSVSAGSDAGFVDKVTWSASATPVITVTAPNGGESWTRGSSQTLRWTAVNVTGTVTLDLYKGGAYLQNLGTATAAAGSFAWTVPTGLTAGSDYKVRVYQGATSDYSDAYFSVTSPAGMTLAEALDYAGVVWSTGGGATWAGQTTTSYYGGDAAKAGTVGNDQNSLLQATFAGPGTVRFWWKVSSEQDYDFLALYINNQLYAYISGSTSWAQKAYTLPAGNYVFQWYYMKDESYASGSDTGWVDKVEFIPSSPAPAWGSAGEEVAPEMPWQISSDGVNPGTPERRDTE
ncbi:MAG: M6 family metalloprotease domain-containing protein [Acidobacteria bacterium]|nr:M6 family metalloprotease domain-containing protein [Acidobacteriota bacterium]